MANSKRHPSTRSTSKRAAGKIRKESPGIEKLVDAMRLDDQFAFARRIIRALASGIEVTIDAKVPGGQASPFYSRAIASRDNLRSQWEASKSSALESFEFGRVAFEKSYAYSDSYGVHFVECLSPLPFGQTKMKLKDGRFYGVEMKGLNEVLEARSVWWCAIDPTPLEPHGRSRYTGAPWIVYQKRRKAERDEDRWYQRHAAGQGKARAPEGKTADPVRGKAPRGDLDDAGQLLDPMDVMTDDLENLESGGFIVLSSKKYTQAQGGDFLYDVEMFPEPKASSPLEQRMISLDKKALRTMGIPDRAISQDGETGSRNVADAHQIVMFDTVEDILSQILASYQEQVIEPTARINFPPQSGVVFEVTYRPLGENPEARVEKIVETILTGGAINPFAVELLDFVRMVEMAGIPVGPDTEQAIQRLREAYQRQSAPAPAPSAYPASALRRLGVNLDPSSGPPTSGLREDEIVSEILRQASARYDEMLNALDDPTRIHWGRL